MTSHATETLGSLRLKRPRASTLAVAAGFLISLGYAIWLLSPRFGIATPSVIDDWNGASQGARSLGDLLLPFVESPARRFRPGFGLFDYIEWHTLGAPFDMTGPNLWNIGRVALLVAGIGVVPALVARAIRPELSPLALGALTALSPAAVITGTTIPVDLARLAPQEPMLIGATVCGAALVLLGLDRHLSGRRLRAALPPAAIGWLLFVVGVTSKEASISFLVAVPFLYAFLVGRWRERGLVHSLFGPLRNGGFLICAVALAIPLLWVAFRAGSISGEGADLYEAGAPTGTGEWTDRLRASWNLQRASLTGTVGSPIWHALAVGLPFLAAAVVLDRRRMPWLALGLGLAAAVMLVLQGLPAVVTSRYFLPTMALLAMSASLLLAQAQGWLRWTALAATAILVATGASAARQSVQAWAADEKATSSFVDQVATLTESGCTIHLAGVDIERSEALPRLVALKIDAIGRRCANDADALVVTLPSGAPQAVGDTGVWSACREPWKPEAAAGIWVLLRCDALKERVGGQRAATFLRPALMVPGVGPTLRNACLELDRDDLACDRPVLERGQSWP